jgi:hypothetical protein
MSCAILARHGDVCSQHERAAARASRTGLDDPGTSLVNQVVSLRSAADAVVFDDYRAEYDRNQAEFFVSVTTGIDRFYQQLHAATASAARLVGQHASPKIDVKTLAALDADLAQTPGHSLAPRLRAIRREVNLLRWLSTVRNKAVSSPRATRLSGSPPSCDTPPAPTTKKPTSITPAHTSSDVVRTDAWECYATLSRRSRPERRSTADGQLPEAAVVATPSLHA